MFCFALPKFNFILEVEPFTTSRSTVNVFDEKTLRQLEQLALVADNVRVGAMKGDRRSKKRGESIEFADYRDYAKGDDLRRLDWNVYARLQKPFIKLLEEEEDLSVHLLLDSSQSMDWPTTEHNKLIYAQRLLGALGHIALATGDQVTVKLLGAGERERWGPFRGHNNSLRLFQFLESAATAGITDLNLSLREYALRGRRPGLLFLISDLFSPSGYREGVSALQSRGYEVGILHVLSPDELNPGMNGDLKLVDIETGADAEITLDGPTLQAYRESVQGWQAEIAAFCSGRGIHYVPVETTESWQQLVMRTLRARGLVK